MTLPYSSSSSITISKYAIEGLKKIYKKGIEYKKAGVIVLGLIPTDSKQLNIFEKENPKHQILMKTLDFITKKEGISKIKLASQDLKRVWKMKQTKLSSRYTTGVKSLSFNQKIIKPFNQASTKDAVTILTSYLTHSY